MSILMQELPRRHRITVEHFYRMAEAGLFAADERVELMDGEIIDVPPMGSRHAGMLDQLARLLSAAVGPHVIVRQQLPVRLSDDTEPLPDIALVNARDDNYKSGHPMAADTLLLIEISSSTLRFDQERKVPLYARHNIPEVWVVDVGREQIHCYRSPQNGRYTVSAVAPLSDRLRIASLGTEIDLSSATAQLTD